MHQEPLPPTPSAQTFALRTCTLTYTLTCTVKIDAPDDDRGGWEVMGATAEDTTVVLALVFDAIVPRSGEVTDEERTATEVDATVMG